MRLVGQLEPGRGEYGHIVDVGMVLLFFHYFPLDTGSLRKEFLGSYHI